MGEKGGMKKKKNKKNKLMLDKEPQGSAGTTECAGTATARDLAPGAGFGYDGTAAGSWDWEVMLRTPG